MKRYWFFCLVCISIAGALSSCEKLFIKPNPENTAVENFEHLWKTVDEKYSYFELKRINWDSVYQVYRPKVYKGMSNDSLFRVLDATLFTLRDGHVNLWSEFNVSRNWQWYLDYPQNFNRGLLERNYWGNDFLITGPLINKTFRRNGKNIGYIYYGSFSSTISDFDLDYVLNDFKNTDGLIIDIRDNGGGLTTEIYQLLNRFVDDKRVVLKSYEKGGPGHGDFYLSLEHKTEPVSNEHVSYIQKPIVVLTNRSCYSAATMFAGAMSELPQVRIVGDVTGGGGGLPVSNQLPNGWYFRFSATKTVLPNGYDLESGVPVDIRQDMSTASENAGIDDILEKAFTLF
ncbi:MAG: S41 family peptidase [Cytophagaceae bacterium]|jgi:hypothetical protein|nr:S41 family peptidase [Cytophagaceae bacterium]